MIKLLNLRFALLISYLVFNLSVSAQIETSLEDTVVISASRLQQSIRSSGRSITVINRETISTIPANSVDEILRYVAGVEVQSRNNFGVQADIIIRGSTFTQVLVLIDGMRLNDPLTGHFNGYIPIAKAEIERIEILRGPGAAMYGPDAVGGVIHIFSRTYVQSLSEQGISSEGNIALGEYGFSQLNGLAAYQDEKFRISLSGSRNNADGQELISGSNGDFDIWNGSLALSYRDADWLLGYRTAYDQRTFNAQYFYTRSTFDESREQTTQWWHQARVQKNHGSGFTRLDVSLKASQDSFLFNPAFPANIHDTRYSNVHLMHTHIFKPSFQLQIGAQADKRAVESSDRGDHSVWHQGIYLSSIIQANSNLSIHLGLRGDNDENYGFEVLPQASIAFQKDPWLLRAASGRSIRAADFTERFVSNNLEGPLPAGRNFGNPDLEAERAWTHELGVGFYPNKSWDVNATYFVRQGKNLIDYILTNANNIPQNTTLIPNENYFFTQNFSEVGTQGLELQANIHHQIGQGQQLNAGIGYTLIDITGDEDNVSKYISNHANQLVSWQGVYQHPRFWIGINGLWKDRDSDLAQAIGAELDEQYAVLNARAGFFVIPALALYIEIQNIGNTQYQDILGSKMPDRWTIAGLRWQLGGRKVD